MKNILFIKNYFLNKENKIYYFIIGLFIRIMNKYSKESKN